MNQDRLSLPPDVAQELLLGQVRPLEPEWVPVAAAGGRVLAEDVMAGEDLPSFDRAALDGFALRTDGSVPGTLRVIGTAAAGRPYEGEVGQGEAVAITTGAPMPAGTDAVIAQERVTLGDGTVQIQAACAAGDGVVRRGADLARGHLALPRGTRLLSGSLGLLAALGRNPVPVHGRPRVAVFATGDELVPAEREPGPAQIRASNLAMLSSAAERCGAQVVAAGVVSDDVELIAAALDKASRDGADLILTSGGASGGRFDLMRAALDRLGAVRLFDWLAMRPAPGTIGACIGRAVCLSLPGNPGAALTAFDLLVRPLLARFNGAKQVEAWVVEAELAAPLGRAWTGIAEERRFARAQISWHEGRFWADPRCGLQRHPSPVLAAALGNGLVVVPEGREAPAPGQMVRAMICEEGTVVL